MAGGSVALPLDLTMVAALSFSFAYSHKKHRAIFKEDHRSSYNKSVSFTAFLTFFMGKE